MGVVAAMQFHRDPSAVDMTSAERTVAGHENQSPRNSLFIVDSPRREVAPNQRVFAPTLRSDDAGSPASLHDLSPPPDLGSEFPVESPVQVSSSSHSGAQKQRTHKIGQNETLYDIAKRYWGKGDLYLELYKANVEVLVNPNDLPVGRSIVIPDLPKKTSVVPPSTAGNKLVPIKWKRKQP